MRRTIQGRAALVRAYSSEVQPVRSKKQRGRSSHADLETGDPGVASFIHPDRLEGLGSPAGMAGSRAPCDSPRPRVFHHIHCNSWGRNRSAVCILAVCTGLHRSAQVCMGRPVTYWDSWGRSRLAAAFGRCSGLCILAVCAGKPVTYWDSWGLSLPAAASRRCSGSDP